MTASPRNQRRPGRAACLLRDEIQPLCFVRGLAILTFVLSGLLADGSQGQTTPRIDCLFPPGAQRGTETTIAVQSEFAPAACRLVFASPGLTSPDAEVTDRFLLRAAPDTSLGSHEIRLALPQGGSAPFPFLLGDLPEQIHDTESTEPLEVSLPVTINGRLAAERTLHHFHVRLTAGQQLVAAATTQAINSSVDPLLQLLDAQGVVAAEGFAHHTADALMVFRAPADGLYTIQLRDFQLAGGPQHVYRLTLTTGPWLDDAFPPGLPENSKARVTLHGWNLPGQGDGSSCEHEVATGPAGRLAVRLPGGANELSLVVGHDPETTEAEPNDTIEQAMPVAGPVTINGRFSQPGDLDLYQVMGVKGESLAFDVAAADLAFPTDAVLAILDPTGKVLREIDDTRTSRDPSYRYAPSSDGPLYVQLRERSDRGGEAYAYRLSITGGQPSLAATVDVSSFPVYAGETTNLPVKVEQIDKPTGAWEVTAIGLPPGVTVESQPTPAKPTDTVQLPLTVAPGVGSIAGLVQIVVRSTDREPPVSYTAQIRESAKATTSSPHLWLAVSPHIPFKLSVGSAILEAPQLAAFPFPVDVEREEGFDGQILLLPVEPDKRGTVVPLTGLAEAGSSTGHLPLIIQKEATEGTTQRCRVMGVVQVLDGAKKSVPVFHVASGNLSMGCAPGRLVMNAEPAIVAWQPGESRQITVQLMRRVAMDAIQIGLKTPESHPGLVCSQAEVAADQDQATLTLQYPAGASLPPRFDIVLQARSEREGLPIYAETTVRLETR
ncbi:COG1470 family protein [Lignipirellula cremea]|uniref:Peptidase C-terminal archaeal/bacterial domain-containing protein n=1 Tax=Lignipirellula cremea TaxID=2528010 RepID=A0A518DS56_9BACT|nr:hypothetical protein [Lignipirellula cremea]QDU94677.1 hypothetical protein Pla8534_24830 [Lignipirellula cremea]